MNLASICARIDEICHNATETIHIAISGGEPTLHPHFFEVLRKLVNHNVDITVLSNASTCADNAFVERLRILLDGKLDALKYVTAIHASNSTMHDAITCIPGSYELTISGLEKLVAAGIKVSIKHIMNKVTYQMMPDTFEDLCTRFPPSVGFEFCSMDFVGQAKKHADALFVSFKELRPFLERTLDILENNEGSTERRVIIHETPLCAVDPYYWVYYSIHGQMKKIYVSPTAIEGTEFDAYQDKGADYPKCLNCAVQDICDGVWRSSYRMSGGGHNLLSPLMLYSSHIQGPEGAYREQ